MLVRVPDYFDAFRCLAGACPHSCCIGWEVVLDEESVERYGQVAGTLGGKLRAAMTTDDEGDVCFPLSGGRCPFLDDDNLCEIHRQLGEAATSVTCREHPRFIEDYGPFREITLSASCPAANALLLGSDAPLTFTERVTAEPEEAGDPWLAFLLPLRERMLETLRDRSTPLRARLRRFLALAAQAQMDEAWDGKVPDSTGEGDIPLMALPDEDGGEALFPAGLRFLQTLEVLEDDWRALLQAAEDTPPPCLPEALLERAAVYFAFRYLLKAVNDGDVLSRAQLVVFSVLTVERLAGVCGLPEALRRFSREVEHNEENLTALLEAFWREEGLSTQALLREVSE